jgi:hypothetical protein
MAFDSAGEPGETAAGADPVAVAQPDPLSDVATELAPAGIVDAGEPLYVVVNENGEHLSHHRTPEGAQSAWDSAPDAAGIHETELHQ